MLTFGGRSVNELTLDHSVEVNAFTGASSLTVPIHTSDARTGASPSLALSYASGGGNSAFGAGWNLAGLPAVGVDTRYRVPRWDNTDGFQFGNDEIVPWLVETGGVWTPRGFVSGTWSVAFYRSRRGSAKTRIEKWVDTRTGRVHFRTRDAYNCITVYGARPNAAGRIADPNDESRTFIWLPELILDAKGNAQWIEYAAETLDGVDRTASYERVQPSLAQRYLKRISYGNLTPLALDDTLAGGQLPAGLQWLFQLVVDYGDHSGPLTPSVMPDRPWLGRADPFSSYACGFEVRTYRLARRFLTFHNFAELGAAPVPVQALTLTHAEDPAGSTLTEIALTGIRWDAAVASASSIPPLKLSYAPAATDVAFSEAGQTASINAPAGLAGVGYSFVDLFGEGLSGILFQNERTWYYKANRGSGEFGDQTVVTSSPAVGTVGFANTDFDANGNTEFAQLGSRSAGFYELDRQTLHWSGFRPFPEFPHVESFSAKARWVDLNGDRRPDVVVTHGDHFTWFESDGDTFRAPVDVPRPRGIDAIPTLADDAELEFIFADMTGDGLADLVRVQPGAMTYWPSLGNGLFGEAVVMEGTPQFAPAGQFDASRVRAVDLDGSGTADVVYLGHGEVRCWINACGNELVPGPSLAGMPYFDNVSSVRVLDFLGDGRSCLVWSSPLPGRESPLEYLCLAPAVRPRLLIQVDDSLGRVTTLEYSSSATHYLRDLESGRGWNTRMPGHHPVVDQWTVVDQIGGTQSLTRYEYHDGFYDGRERELRGFGQVDIYDSDSSPPPGNSTTVAPAVMPALERRWYHLGTAWSASSSAQYFAGDPQLPLLSPHLIDTGVLLIAPSDMEDGLRALAGDIIRRETYAVAADGSAAPNPFEVRQTRYRLRLLQPAQGAGRAAFSRLTLESATWTYEQQSADPRLVHEVVIDSDDYDQPVRSAVIGYARRAGNPTDIDDQGRYHIRVDDQTRIAFDESQRYEFGLPADARSYELAGIRPAPTFTVDQFHAPAVIAAISAPGRHDVELQDDPNVGPKARILTWEQTFYWDDTQANPLPLGQAGALTLLHHEEAVCFEPAFVADVFGARVDNALLGQLGYSQRDGFWWQSDETHGYLPAAQFYQTAWLLRGDGAKTQLGYDTYALLQTAHTDALNNTLQGLIDYCVLAPWRITDPNGTVNEVRYDPLGVIATSTSYGTLGAQPWGFDPLTAVALRTPASLDDAVTNSATFIQGAMQYTWYDLNTWANSATPTTLVTLQRRTLVHDGRGGGTAVGDVAITISYADALGRILQEKTLVEGGPAIARDGTGTVIVDATGAPVMQAADPRWRASGHVVYDAKERVARQFEPFFTGIPEYESDAVLEAFGTSTLTSYDVVGRVVRTDFPNGTFSTNVYKTWSVAVADTNDNVVGSAYGVLRQGLPAGDPQLQAYQEAAAHANTLNIDYLDPLAQVCGHLAQGGATAADQFSQSHRDPTGCETTIIDPRSLTALTARFDMQRRPLYQKSIDHGEVWRLPDAYGRDTNSWDGRQFALTQGYDLLDRHVYTEVTGGDGAAPLNNRIEEWVYGESLANRPAAIAANLLGRAAVTRDSAQQMTVNQCDPGGRVCSITRQLRSVVDAEPDWRAAVPLEPDSYTETASFDAQGRTVSDTLADGTVRSFTYARSGVLSQVLVTTPDGSLTAVPILADASVNARGQRLSASYGNGVVVQLAYDPTTYRATTQTATRGGSVFQQIGYTYDPIGNIVRVTDAAQEQPASLIAGVTVPARRDYVYDAHYRLRQASGRVHQALLQNDFVPGAPGTFMGTRQVSFNDGTAIERFTRTYDFDASGNLMYVKHVGTSRSWTSNMWISTTSNRSLPALDLNGNPIVSPESNFDAAGNNNVLAHLRSMQWSWRNQLAQTVVVARPGGTDDAERYLYGGDGMRVRRLTTRVIAGGSVELTEKVYFNDLERKRISLDGKLTLERWSIHVSDGESRAAIVHRWTQDAAGREVDDISKAHIHYQLVTHQASVAVELDASAALISYEEYFPYGATAFIAGNDLREVALKDYRYSAKECDDFTGLYSYGFRYYAPWACRWLSPDPDGPGDDLNLYQFVLGNPVSNTDPNGLDTKDSDPSERPHVRAIASNRLGHDNPMMVQARAWYQSLTPSEKKLMENPNYVMTPRNLDDPAGGAVVVTQREFQRKYLPKMVAWAKKHHIKNVNIIIPKTDPPTAAATDEDGGAGNAAQGSEGLESSDHTKKEQESSESEGGGGTGKNDDGADKTSTNGGGASGAATNGAGGAGGTSASGADAGDGSGNVGTSKKGAIDQGDGAGSTPGSSRTGTGTGAGSGADAKGRDTGAGGGDARGTRGGAGGGGVGAAGKAAAGGSVGSEFGEVGGRADGVIGGEPFSPGGSLDALGNPLILNGASNGSEHDGAVTETRRHSGRGSRKEGSDATGGGSGTHNTNNSQQSHSRGSPTGSGGQPAGHPNGQLNGTTAAQPNPNANSTAKGGQGEGGGSNTTGATGAKETILKVLGYANLEFGGGDKNGGSGGIPGGRGSHSGLFWQILYAAITIVDVILIVKSVIQSVAKGLLSRLWRLVRSPRALLRGLGAFMGETAGAWRKLWSRAGGGPGKRIWKFVVRLFKYESRAADPFKVIRAARNKSFWLKPRWFGTLERVGEESLYTWEHIIPQSVGRRFPRLMPFINSYANSWLRLPLRFNSALGDRLAPKLLFYLGAEEAVRRSGQFGVWFGHNILDDNTEPATAKPAR